MKSSPLDQIIKAVLYEGYILYPYRPSAKKNQQRFTFGRVYPQAYSLSQNSAEPFAMQTECLVRSQAEMPYLEVNLRFLHPLARTVGALAKRVFDLTEITAQSFQPVPELSMDGQLYQTWQEAVEREVKPSLVTLDAFLPTRVSFPFRFYASREFEPIRDRQHQIAGAVQRQQEGLEGMVEILTEPVETGLFKVTARILNHTPMGEPELSDASAVLLRTFVSTHTILRVQGGEFISLTDPPPACKKIAASCKNNGTWPVLIGDEAKGERHTLLSSPIILPDYPKVAAESSGDFFDGTEIDEMLTLRIKTMTDAEKHEMRHVDEQARRLLERTETMGDDHLLKSHGVMRASRSFDETVFGGSTPLKGVSFGDTHLQAGDCVRIRPKARGEVMDLALAGKIAVIEAVEQDAEGQVHLALVLEDDPGKDLGMMRQPGHRFFFGLDEIELPKEAT